MIIKSSGGFEEREGRGSGWKKAAVVEAKQSYNLSVAKRGMEMGSEIIPRQGAGAGGSSQFLNTIPMEQPMMLPMTLGRSSSAEKTNLRHETHAH